MYELQKQFIYRYIQQKIASTNKLTSMASVEMKLLIELNLKIYCNK